MYAPKPASRNDSTRHTGGRNPSDPPIVWTLKRRAQRLRKAATERPEDAKELRKRARALDARRIAVLRELDGGANR